jgi:predicted DNA-binding protein
MSNQLHDSIAEYISGRFYGRKLIGNAWRGTYAECLVYSALRGGAPEAGWRPSGEWDPWDLENGEGIHLQVKQSAARQSWTNPKGPGKPHAMSFDIHPGEKGRQTHIYVFAWHPESDPDIADHRDTGQWRFYVMPEDGLPEPEIGQKTQRISLNRLKELADSVGAKVIGYNQLAAVINFVAEAILRADLEDYRLAEEAIERIRRGEERILTEAELSASLGLDS